MNKREGKRREREVEEERKTERKINSYYETNTTFKQVLEGPDHYRKINSQGRQQEKKEGNHETAKKA